MSGLLCVNGRTKHRSTATKERCPLCKAKTARQKGAKTNIGDTGPISKPNSLDELREAVQYEQPTDIDTRYVESLHESAKCAALINALRRGGRKTIDGQTEGELLDRMEEEKQKQKIFEDEFEDRGGWTRYYLVTGGHLHSNTSCGGLKYNTTLHLTPQVSGMSDDEVVEYAGERMCTTCNPDAPVDALRKKSTLFTPEEKAEAEQREKAQAEAEARAKEKARKKAANALPAPVLLPESYSRDGAVPIESKSKATQAVNYIFDTCRVYGDELNDEYQPEVARFFRMTSPDASDEEIVEKYRKKLHAAKRKSIRESQHYYRQGLGSPEETDREQSERIERAMSWLAGGLKKVPREQ